MPHTRTDVHKCDHCGRAETMADGEVPPIQFWWVGLSVCHSGSRDAAPREGTPPKQYWCRACCEKFHLLPLADISDKDLNPEPPTLDDMIREIVREEVAAT